ncbi:small, acid-soluble spore protein H [Pullulanibacillus camelliae]|uniref:Small, acid-soluble spore protein H n=1 Tax=Pullulanibacillus camelliae TaxID=1707096 RepID=A0A8J2VLI8_9BACL|nr:H-type small acid-soluble spore protein [Pullulanibacillus camelliae]GGE30587.1 small, acid-soluble spore protein H [Pullulanibacillus camelliae]
MNKERAIEIVNSPEMISVSYQGQPIYIQHVNDSGETARIYPLSAPEQEQEVPLTSLIEQ